MKNQSVDFTLFRMLAVGANFLFFDVPEEFQMTLQDPATGIMEALIDFHHDLVFFFVIIVTLVFWLLGRLLYLFDQDHVDFRVAVINAIYRKKLEYIAVLPMNFSKNLVAEIIWTIIPFLILLYIMPSSFSLLYAMDDMMIPSVTMKCHGHQWFWNYNMADTRVFVSSAASDLDSLMINQNFDTFFDFSEDKSNNIFVAKDINMDITKFQTYADLINFVPIIADIFASEKEIVDAAVNEYLNTFNLFFIDIDPEVTTIDDLVDDLFYVLGLFDSDDEDTDDFFGLSFEDEEADDTYIPMDFHTAKIFKIFLMVDLNNEPLARFLLHAFSTVYSWNDYYLDTSYSAISSVDSQNLGAVIAQATGISPAILVSSDFDYLLTADNDFLEDAWVRSFAYDYPIVKKMQKLFFDSYMVGDSDLKPGQFRLLEVDKHICLPLQVFSRLLISAEDVIHSFAIPSLGVKMDAVPGRSNQVGVLIKRLGRFYGQCSEICGANHAFMPIVLECVSQVEFIKWYDSNSVYLPL